MKGHTHGEKYIRMNIHTEGVDALNHLSDSLSAM